MKTRRLPEIDLAKFAVIDDQEHLEGSLRAFNTGGGSWSYGPSRQLIPDILAARLPLVGDLSAPSWEIISAEILRRCTRGEVQEQSNLEVSDLLYKYCGTEKWRSAKIDMHALPIGFGDSVRYWSDVVIQDDNGLFIPFFDHRRTKGLKGIQENRFVFSMQNFWIRERFLDLRSARLAVISFPTARKMRGLSIQFGKEEELMSYDELDSRVRRVYEAWAKVSEERTTKRRETGTDGPTPFGF